jgi:O-methyltransferase involved in polyketide biosynthesis
MDIDTTKPNAGRIYDYYLGGNHNFEADRNAAEQLLKLIPSTKTGARLNRWFMYDVVQRLAQSGFDCYLDLGTGLPTGGYIHDLAPNARVLYSDIDAVTVAYGQQIIGDKPRVRYIQANVADINAILQEAAAHFGAQRKITVCFIGMTYFVEPGVLRTILDRIFDWCAPGSQMALSFLAGDVSRWQQSQFAAIYRQMKAPVYGLEVADVYRLLEKWQIDDPGLQPLNQWNGVDEWRIEEGPEAQDLDLYGVVVTKA